jgi:hypothetical protein
MTIRFDHDGCPIHKFREPESLLSYFLHHLLNQEFNAEGPVKGCRVTLKKLVLLLIKSKGKHCQDQSFQ